PELPELRPARAGSALALRTRRGARAAGDVPPGRLADQVGAASLRAPARDGRDRDPPPGAADRDGAPRPPVADRHLRRRPQAPTRLRRRLGRLLPPLVVLLRDAGR